MRMINPDALPALSSLHAAGPSVGEVIAVGGIVGVLAWIVVGMLAAAGIFSKGDRS